MSQQNRTLYSSSIAILLLCMLVGVFLFGRKRRAKPNDSEKVVTHSVKTSPKETLEYWTQDRMRNAEPAPMPVVDERHLGKRLSDDSRS